MASDRETLARVLSQNWRNMHTNEALGLQRMLADAILTSDWLKEHDRQVRKQALPNADTLARTIHAVGPCSDEDCANPDDWGYCDKRAEAILRAEIEARVAALAAAQEDS